MRAKFSCTYNTGYVQIKTSIEIKSGVTLRLPWGSGDSDYNEDYLGDFGGGGANPYDAPAEDNEDYLITHVILAEGITISIAENGVLDIAGELSGGGYNAYTKFGVEYAGHTARYHALLEMDDNSKIYCSGTINAFGYIRETSENNGSYIYIESKGTMYQPFVIRDYRSGNYVAAVTEFALMSPQWTHKFAPFTRFIFMNVSPWVKTSSGGKIVGVANLYANDTMNNSAVALVGDSNEGFLRLPSGSYMLSKYNVETQVMDIDIYGGAELKSLTLSLVGSTIGQFIGEVSSSSFTFAFTYHQDISLNALDGCTNAYTMLDAEYKMLPGAKLLVGKGTTLTLKSLSIYDSNYVEELMLVTNTGAKKQDVLTYPTDKGDAMFIVRGTVVADYLGGNVYADEQSDGATVTINESIVVTTYEITKFFLSSVNDIIKSGGIAPYAYKSVTYSTKLHYITSYDADGNIATTNKVGYVTTDNLYTANGTTKKWEPATAVTIPTEITFTVPAGCTVETNEQVVSIDRPNQIVEYTYMLASAGETIKVLPGAVVVFHMESANYLYIEEGAKTSHTITPEEIPTGAYSKTWLANATVPAVYWVPALSISGYGILETCDVTYNLSAGTASLFMENTRGLSDPQNFKFSTNGGTSYTNATEHTSGIFIKYVSKYNYTLSNISVNTSVLIVAQ